MSSKPSRCLRFGVHLAVLLVPVWTARAAEPPRMVVDLNTQTVNGSALPPRYDSTRSRRVEMGGVLYFAAADPMHGMELWRSDGTPGGTRLVRDIRPGPSGSDLQALTVHQGRFYFFADDGVWGLELWSSDGTREGTRLVRDLCPGACAGTASSFMASAGSQLFFAAGSHFDLDLWRTDGTREGTRQVVDPCPGCYSNLADGFVPLPDGRVFFAANHPESGFEPWVTDGTPGGTRVLDVLPGVQGSFPVRMIALGDRVLFWFYDHRTPAFELWTSDGTLAGTQVVRRNVRWPVFKDGLVVWEGSVYFSNDDGELWRTDGTPDGTIRLRVFETGPTPYSAPYWPTGLTPLPGGVLFIAGDSARGMALWQTRGTGATTQILKDPVPGSESLDLVALHGAGSRAFFLARSVEGTVDLWVSNGTAKGTRRVAPLCRGSEECVASDERDVASAGGLSFIAVHSTTVGSELWRSDGSARGTFLPRDIHSGPGSALLGEIAALDGRALFGALTVSPSDGPATLWSSDGTAAGTVPVDGEAPWPQDFVRQGDHVYFSGALSQTDFDPLLVRRQGLWRTDGTPAGTTLLAGDLFDLDLFALDENLLYLGARDHVYVTEGTGIELWRSDGTPGGTRQVLDLDRELDSIPVDPPIVMPGSSEPGPPVRLGPVLLYAADDGLTGRELWATDGTEAGTRLVRDINQRDLEDPGYFFPAESLPEALVRLGEVVLFVADDGLSGRELWVTDGTEAGTHRLRDLRPGAEGSRPHDLVELGGAVYFFASAGLGEALWRTDGTEAGTVQVKSLARQGLPSWGRSLTPAGDRLFFVADNEATGPELHVSDGTLAGTRLVRQIRQGANGSYPQSFAVVDGVLVFAADNGTHGLEPWRSDGTALGTWSLGDLAPGPAASAPSTFTAAGPRLFFAADDGVHGRELWVIGGLP